MPSTLRLGCAAALLPLAAAAQPAPRLAVGEDRPVRAGLPDLALLEPHLAVDPRDADHLVAGTIVVRKPDMSETACAALASFDGGRTWTRHDFPVAGCGDPRVAILPDGGALFVALGDSLVVFRSADGGRTWGARGAGLGRGHDYATLVVDTTRGPHAGTVYVVSAQGRREAPGRPARTAVFVARSADGGATFAEPTRLVVGNLDQNTLNPVVLADGALVVPYGQYGRTMADGAFARLARDLDWAVTSADGGRTFATPTFVADGCGLSWPQLAVDASPGPHRDRLYWLCGDPARERLLLQHSADRGERWSDPVLVNAGAGRTPYARAAVLAVNARGVVAVSWYDARGDRAAYKGQLRCQALHVTASLDGGRTFLPDAKVSSAPNCPAAPRNGDAALRWPAGGDYHGLAAAPDGSFRLLWADSRDGIYQLRTATVRVEP